MSTITATTGRRKESIARVRMSAGTGKLVINKREAREYLKRDTLLRIATQPLDLLEMTDQYDITVNVHGGGLSGQAGAIRLGIARALNELDRDGNRPRLKAAGYLTRDSRVVERKKPGQPSARKKFQFSKR